MRDLHCANCEGCTPHQALRRQQSKKNAIGGGVASREGGRRCSYMVLGGKPEEREDWKK